MRMILSYKNLALLILHSLINHLRRVLSKRSRILKNHCTWIASGRKSRWKWRRRGRNRSWERSKRISRGRKRIGLGTNRGCKSNKSRSTSWRWSMNNTGFRSSLRRHAVQQRGNGCNRLDLITIRAKLIKCLISKRLISFRAAIPKRKHRLVRKKEHKKLNKCEYRRNNQLS